MSSSGGESEFDDIIKLSVFSSIGTSIVAEYSIRGVLDRVMEHVGAFFAPLNWSLMLKDTDKEELVFAVAVGKSSDRLLGMRIPAGEGIAGWVAEHGVSAIVDDTASDSRWSDRLDRETGFETRSIIAVPLRSGDRVFGVIELINRLDGRAFTAYEMRVLSTIADFAAIAVEKAYYLAEARRLSEVDHLTGALNRRGLTKAIDRETSRIERYGGDLSVLLADVDDFKRINDTFGHAAGDTVLKAVSAALATGVRHADSVARYGGDEFLVVMPGVGEKEAAEARMRLQEILDAAGKAHAPAFSVTLGVHSAKDADFQNLFEASDRDLYRRKAEPIAIGDNILTALDEERKALDARGPQR